jgi:uncharacterized protein YbjT (DUF2867 family)
MQVDLVSVEKIPDIAVSVRKGPVVSVTDQGLSRFVGSAFMQVSRRVPLPGFATFPIRYHWAMRILFAGATGVLGRATLPHLSGHHVTGLTRSPEKLQALRELGAEPALCDVYDYQALLTLAERTRPHLVVNFVTDLASGSAEANSRARREGGENLRNVAEAAGASRLVVESVAFTLEDEAAEAIDMLEQTAQDFPADVLILRFGRLWGLGTFHQAPPDPPAVHIDKAGAEAARIVVYAPPGTYTIAESSTSVD